MAQAIFFIERLMWPDNVTSVKPNKNPKPNTIFRIRTSLVLYQNIKYNYCNL